MYGVGVVLALLLQLVGISPLAFGLGMYLPMSLNVPILIGAVVAALVKVGARDEATSKARNEKGILLASGLVAGAAITGVVVRALQAVWPDFMYSIDITSRRIAAAGAAGETVRAEEIGRFGNWLGLLMFAALCLFIFWDARRVKPTEEPRAKR
jgi:NADH:ubiquinone oxidoreductase subunit 6 (subunit J)